MSAYQAAHELREEAASCREELDACHALIGQKREEIARLRKVNDYLLAVAKMFREEFKTRAPKVEMQGVDELIAKAEGQQ